ncbi:CBD9-like protein, partial [Microthyrium microscopicum]
LGSVAAQSTPAKDAATGIDFQSYSAPSGFKFGIALPESGGEDFIGQIAGPLTGGNGWVGISLGGSMRGPLLIAAWSNEGKSMGSIRKATSYSNPPVYTGASSLKTIAAGSTANATHMTYTFLCSKCVTGDALSFSASAPTAKMGFAMSSGKVAKASDPATALTYHTAGKGQYTVDLAGAKKSGFAAWAAKA